MRATSQAVQEDDGGDVRTNADCALHQDDIVSAGNVRVKGSARCRADRAHKGSGGIGDHNAVIPIQGQFATIWHRNVLSNIGDRQVARRRLSEPGRHHRLQVSVLEQRPRHTATPTERRVRWCRAPANSVRTQPDRLLLMANSRRTYHEPRRGTVRRQRLARSDDSLRVTYNKCSRQLVTASAKRDAPENTQS